MSKLGRAYSDWGLTLSKLTWDSHSILSARGERAGFMEVVHNYSIG
jgi:hypothetical protein